MKRLLTASSYVFHPLFIPLYSVLCFMRIDENSLTPLQKMLVAAQVLILTVFIPVALYFLLRTIGKIDSVMAGDVRERRIPLAAQIVLLFLLIRQSVAIESVPELPYFYTGLLLSAALLLGLALARYKASLHMAGMGAMLAFIAGTGLHNSVNLISFVAFLLVLTGLVASSRLEMKAHSGKELLVGYCCGILPQIALFYLWL